MDENERYQKIDLQAVMDAILPVFRPTVKVAVMQHANGINILIDDFRIGTDDLICINLALSGRHNFFDVSSFCIYDELHNYHLCLEGSVYRMLPKFLDCRDLVTKKTLILKHEPNE